MANTLELAAPTTLLVDTNVRATVGLTPAFIDNIRANGVLEPVVAHRGSDGALRVLMGQRRTLAAVEASLATIPVYIIDSPDEADRIMTQVAENDQRTALTDGVALTNLGPALLSGHSRLLGLRPQRRREDHRHPRVKSRWRRPLGRRQPPRPYHAPKEPTCPRPPATRPMLSSPPP